MLINIEQRPNPENRVVLARDRDALGVPSVAVHWRWRDEEQAELERLRQALCRWVEASGIGRVEVEAGRPDPNAHHHAGTTRMHTDPRFGVADADARVHGTENLYVTGASVFPTAGFANPTLTIVATALRLADHLKQRV
jgi:choline dehydrogenase-like flavoprotein